MSYEPLQNNNDGLGEVETDMEQDSASVMDTLRATFEPNDQTENPKSSNGERTSRLTTSMPEEELSASFMHGCTLNPTSPMYEELERMLLDEMAEHAEASGRYWNESSDNSPAAAPIPPAAPQPPANLASEPTGLTGMVHVEPEPGHQPHDEVEVARIGHRLIGISRRAPLPQVLRPPCLGSHHISPIGWARYSRIRAHSRRSQTPGGTTRTRQSQGRIAHKFSYQHSFARLS